MPIKVAKFFDEKQLSYEGKFMQGKYLRSTLLFGVLLIFAPLSWSQESEPNEQSVSAPTTGVDTGEAVARRKLMYDLCKQQGGATFIRKMEPDNSGIAGGQVCFKIEFKCDEKGSSGYSNVFQTTRRCFDQSMFEDEVTYTNNGGQSNGGYVNGGDGGGGIIITHGSDFCSQGAGCGPCAGKCHKYFSKGKKKRSCIKCLEKHGYYCLASLLSGNRASCSEGSVRYSCSTCRGGGGSDVEYDVDCSVVSKKRCEDYEDDGGRGRRRDRDNDDCPGCRNNPYPPGTGFLNVVTGLGNLFQGIGAGVGMSGLAGVLGTRECRKWYQNYNKDRIATDNPLVDWDCQKFTGAGFGMGHVLNAGYGQIGNMGGFGYNPTFPGNFAGPYGNYNPYFGAGPGGLGGLLGGGIQFGGNLNLGGGLGAGGQFGNPAFQPWFNNGANGLPYGQGQWGGSPWAGGAGQWGGSPWAGGAQGQWGGSPWGGGAQGQWGGSPWGGGAQGQWGNNPYGPGAGIGGPYQGNSAYWQGRMIQEQARRDTGMRYFTPQPINSSWQYMFPR